MFVPDDLIRGFASSRRLDCRSSESGDKSAESREDSVRKDLTRRLKGVCADMSSGEFEVLVGDMTREQLRGESIPGRRLGT
jgi:hypothetical protein